MPSCPKNLTTVLDKKKYLQCDEMENSSAHSRNCITFYSNSCIMYRFQECRTFQLFRRDFTDNINNPSKVIYTVCKITPKKLKCYNILIIVELVNLCNIERGTRTFKILLFGDFFVRVKLISDSKRNCGKIYELSELYYIPNIPDISISNTFIKKIYSEN